MHFEDLSYDKCGAIVRIAFNRPERRNALGNETTRHLVEAFRVAGQDPQVRVVILTGKGESFCAGGDFKDTFEHGAGRTQSQWSERIRKGPNELVRVLQALGKPVVASINGVAVGGGATIALACDIRIASDRARFQFPFSRIGITPEFGCTHLLPRTVGLGRAMELLMLAEMIDAQEALRIGLVGRVVAHADLESTTQAIAERLLEFPPEALGRVKSMVHRAQYMNLEEMLELEAEELGRGFSSGEHRAAIAAFLARKDAGASARTK